MRKIIELIIRASMTGLRLAVAWRLRKMGYTKQGHTWSVEREQITPSDPKVSVSVHEGNAIKELVSAAVATIYKK